jgi:hypothetical protein
VTQVDFYTGSTDKLRTACQLSHKAMQNAGGAGVSGRELSSQRTFDQP